MISNRGDDRLGLCIVGCGRFAAEHARSARERSDRVQLFFASRSLDKAQAYAREHGADGAFGGYEEAVADPRVNALLYTTPHSQHKAHVELAAAHGKHVLLEKPIATTLEDAAAMAKTASQAGIRFMVAENYRYMPVVTAAADLLRQGAIGVVHAIHMQATTYERPTGWRLSRELMGGGALIDGGIHLLSSMRMLAGEPSRISAVTAPKIFPEMDGEEAVSLWTALPNGAVGTLNFSWAVQGEEGSFGCVIVGSGGYISFDFFGSGVELSCGGEKRTIPAPGDGDGLGGLLDAFLAYVGSGEPSRSTPEEATRDLAVVLAAYESVRAGGQPVEVPAGR